MEEYDDQPEEKSFYQSDRLDELSDDDEISNEEDGFMRGYISANDEDKEEIEDI